MWQWGPSHSSSQLCMSVSDSWHSRERPDLFRFVCPRYHFSSPTVNLCCGQSGRVRGRSGLWRKKSQNQKQSKVGSGRKDGSNWTETIRNLSFIIIIIIISWAILGCGTGSTPGMWLSAFPLCLLGFSGGRSSLTMSNIWRRRETVLANFVCRCPKYVQLLFLPIQLFFPYPATLITATQST